MDAFESWLGPVYLHCQLHCSDQTLQVPAQHMNEDQRLEMFIIYVSFTFDFFTN